MVQISLTRWAILSSLFLNFFIEGDENLLSNHLRFRFMMRKGISISLSMLLLLPLFSGTSFSSALAKSFSSSTEICSSDNGASIRFQKPCDMGHCTPLPKCPLCPSSSSIHPYLHQGAGVYLPPPHSSFIIINPDSLSDQSFVSSLFRPPISSLQHALD